MLSKLDELFNCVTSGRSGNQQVLTEVLKTMSTFINYYYLIFFLQFCNKNEFNFVYEFLNLGADDNG